MTQCFFGHFAFHFDWHVYLYIFMISIYRSTFRETHYLCPWTCANLYPYYAFILLEKSLFRILEKRKAPSVVQKPQRLFERLLLILFYETQISPFF